MTVAERFLDELVGDEGSDNNAIARRAHECDGRADSRQLTSSSVGPGPRAYPRELTRGRVVEEIARRRASTAKATRSPPQERGSACARQKPPVRRERPHDAIRAPTRSSFAERSRSRRASTFRRATARPRARTPFAATSSNRALFLAWQGCACSPTSSSTSPSSRPVCTRRRFRPKDKITLGTAHDARRALLLPEATQHKGARHCKSFLEKAQDLSEGRQVEPHARCFQKAFALARSRCGQTMVRTPLPVSSAKLSSIGPGYKCVRV